MVDRLLFSEWLQKERESRNLSQSDLGRISGLHRAIISKIELGISTPAVETYLSLAAALEKSPIELFRVAGLLPPGTSEQVTLEDWMFLLKQLPPADQEEMRQIAVMKIERNRSVEAKGRAGNFKPEVKKKG